MKWRWGKGNMERNDNGDQDDMGRNDDGDQDDMGWNGDGKRIWDKMVVEKKKKEKNVNSIY